MAEITRIQNFLDKKELTVGESFITLEKPDVARYVRIKSESLAL